MWDNWRDTRTGGVEQRFLRVIEWQLHLGLAMENILGFHWIGQYLYKVLSFNISNACGGWPRKPPSLSMLWFANWKKMPHTIAFPLSSWDSGLSKLRMPVVINCSVNVRDRRFQHGRVLWRFFTEGVFDSAWSSAEVNGWDCIWCRNRIAASDWLGWIQKRLMLFGWACNHLSHDLGWAWQRLRFLPYSTRTLIRSFTHNCLLLSHQLNYIAELFIWR